ncbi:uncharacterized protein LOC120104038 [Phoenix dactylifera]|uniref:Uncharacterized protein LOC120104038 n=1 Tax=Phoenix dactylifera TaxID=42345 RepID=A0A8B8ZAB1_PHODC|nr:uncharacterized protein LOC120104038 [Phoenix dactylifera]
MMMPTLDTYCRLCHLTARSDVYSFGAWRQGLCFVIASLSQDHYRLAFMDDFEPSSHVADSTKSDNDNDEVAAMAKSLKKKAKEFKQQEAHENVNAESYIVNAENARSKKKLKSSKSN